MADLTLDLSGIINSAIDKKMDEFDLETQIKELLGDVAKNASKIIEVKLTGEVKDSVKFPLSHKQFPLLLKMSSIKGINVLLTGGAGLSKSTAVEQVAEAFKLDLTSISFSNQTTKTDLLGFIDANGIYRMSSFIDAFKNGKIFLADEMDACSANVLVLLNSAISNGRIELPNNEVVYAHDNFRFIGTANTNLRGSKDGYTARNKLDTATINRFTIINWELDLELEEKLTNNTAWLEIVRTARKTATDLLDGVDITPRSSYNGAKLLEAGVSVDDVIEATIIQALSEDEAEILRKAITPSMRKNAAKSKPLHSSKPEIKKSSFDEIDEIDEITEDDVSDFKW